MVVLLLVGFSASAESEQATLPDWMTRSRLTGDWAGSRDHLEERGVDLGASYTAGFWSNLRGGFETGTRYEGFAEWSIAADLDSLVAWKGADFDMQWHSYHGGHPSDDLVGPFECQPLSGWEAAVSIRFYEISLSQTWGEGRFNIRLGQLAADNDFFLSEYTGELLNAGFGLLPIARSGETVPIYPLAAPGATFRASNADETWTMLIGAYTADPGEDTRDNIGFDYSFDDGVSLIGELRTNRSPFGLSGSYTIGAGGTTTTLEDFETGDDVTGAFGLYVLEALASGGYVS